MADDDITVRLLMQAALEKADFDVILASNGEEAIQLFEVNGAEIDMVMLDVDMPGSNGYDVCKYLRQKVGNKLPIIMVTGMDDVESITHAFELGATDFFTKPINWGLIHYRILYLKRAYLNLLELEAANAHNKAIFTAIPDTMLVLNNTGNIVKAFNYNNIGDLGIVKKAALHQFATNELASIFIDSANVARHNNSVEHFEYQFSTNETRYYEVRIVAINQHELLCLIRDITERKEAEKKVFLLAYFDNLTGLPNRQSFKEKLKNKMKIAKYAETKLAILILDLDGFKQINDTIGHNAGDLVLQWTAERLKNCLRSSDLILPSYLNRQSIELARLDGDEFTIIVPDLQCVEDSLILTQRIKKIMSRSFHIQKHDVVLTTSIGIAVYPDDGEDPETLIKHANTAMHHAKNKGRNNCQFYNIALTRQVEERFNLENNLYSALLKNEFQLVFQPQFDLASNSIQSVEALIRWNHPTRGCISPLEFIPLAEQNGLIIPLGEWVLKNACTQAIQWHRQGKPLKVAVNLSPLQFNDPNLVENVLKILAETGFPPEKLVLEITENALIEHNENILKTLSMLRGYNIQIALDDFGTGYSSIHYLTRLPINTLKVDQVFTKNMLTDRNSFAIVKAIISLSRNLDFSIIAEGIETLAQAQTLKYLGCDVLQGFYFSKPVHGNEIGALTEKHWLIQAANPEVECTA